MKKYTEGGALAEALRGALMAKRQRERGAQRQRAVLLKGSAIAAPPAPTIYNLDKGTSAAMDAVKSIHRNSVGPVSPFGLLRV